MCSSDLIEEIELVLELGAAIVEFDAHKIVVALEGAGEHVEAFRGGEPPVPFQVEPVGDDALVLAVLGVVRSGGAVVDADVEALQRWVGLAELRGGRRDGGG